MLSQMVSIHITLLLLDPQDIHLEGKKRSNLVHISMLYSYSFPTPVPRVSTSKMTLIGEVIWEMLKEYVVKEGQIDFYYFYLLYLT